VSVARHHNVAGQFFDAVEAHQHGSALLLRIGLALLLGNQILDLIAIRPAGATPLMPAS
jgi:hypothetical protein